MAGLTQSLTLLINAKSTGAVASLKAVERELDLLEKDAKKTGVAFDRVGERSTRLNPLQKSISGISDATGIAEQTISRFGAAAAFAGGAFALSFGVKAVGAASHLNETISQTGQIFKASSDEVIKFAKNAIDIGLSDQAALSAAAGFGTLFKGIGQTNDQAAKLSIRLTELGADLASFSDTSVDQALAAIQSGLVGEVEPLRKYGVLLNDATIRQEAMKEGLVSTTTQALTPAQKALATYGVLLDQTSLQQGDFKRTSGELAGQQKTLGSSIDNLTVAIGDKLIPIVTAAVAKLNETGPSISRTAGPLGEMVNKVGDVHGALKGFVDAVPGLHVLTDLTNPVSQFSTGIDDLSKGFNAAREAGKDFDRTLGLTADKVNLNTTVFADLRASQDRLARSASELARVQVVARGAFYDSAAAADAAAIRYGNATRQALGLAAGLGIAAAQAHSLGVELNTGATLTSNDPFANVIPTATTFVSSFGDALAFTLGQAAKDGVGGGLDAAKPAVDELGDYLRAVATDRLSKLGNVIDGLTAKLSFDDATTGLADVEAKLAALKAEAAGSKVAVGQQQSLVGQLLVQATQITPSEQVAIEQAQKNLDDVLARFRGTVSQTAAPGSSFLGPTTIDVQNGPSATLAEVQVAEENLADAKAKAVGPTQELKDAEKALQDLRDRQLELPKLIAETERDLTRARLALVEAERREIDLGGELIAQGPESVAWYQQIAAQAGLTAGQIDVLTGSLVALKRESAASQGLVDVFGNGFLFDTPANANALLTLFGGVPKFAAGGFVGGAKGAPQLAVVHGGERVLTAGQQRSAGGDTFVINVSAWDKASAPAIARAVADEIAARSRRGTPLAVR